MKSRTPVSSFSICFIPGLPDRLERDVEEIVRVSGQLQQHGFISSPAMLVLSAPVLDTCSYLLGDSKQLHGLVDAFASGCRSDERAEQIKQRAGSLQSSAVAMMREVTIRHRLEYREPVVSMQLALLRAFGQHVELLAAQALVIAG
jgi:hypothetical protein